MTRIAKAPDGRGGRRALLAAAGLLALVLPDHPASAGNYGRETGAHEIVTTEIAPAADEDLYVFDAAPGWRLAAQVRRVGKSDLAPVLELLDPDGAPVTEEVRTKERKKAASLKALLLREGRYALRVGSSAGPGTYRFRYRLKQGKAKKVNVRRDPLAAGEERPYPFAAADGAEVSWKLKWKGDGTARVARILDPAGVDVPFDAAAVKLKRNGEVMKNVPLAGPGGLYALVVASEFGTTEVTLKVLVKLPRESRAKVELSAAEPRLDSVDPGAGGMGVPVTLSGDNLDAAPGGVLFGDAPGTDVDVAGGTSATVTPPEGEGDVPVVWVNADGQVAVLPEPFTYYPPPVPQGFSPEGGPLEGGQLLTLEGASFRKSEEAFYRVFLREGQATDVTVENPTTLTCRTPPGFAGPAELAVRDRYGQTASAPLLYLYAPAPLIAEVRPGAVPVFGDVEATVTGTGFRADDEILVGGVVVDSEPITFEGDVVGHRITVPAHSHGTVDVAIRDRFGQIDVLEDGLAYFTFTDVTATAVPAASSTDDWGGVSTAGVDMDGDGVLDRLVIAHGEGLSATRPGVRVLENDGTGTFTDATASTMPAAGPDEDFGAATVLAGDLNGDGAPDLYLGRSGTGDEARVDSAASNHVVPWGRILLDAGDGTWADQPTTGDDAVFAISGIPHCSVCGSGSRCYLFDYDFRSTAAAMGDLDGDLDPDVVLVNDRSLTRFKGSGTYAIYIGCRGGVQWANYVSYDYGSALRLLSSGSSGGVTDRTKEVLQASYSARDDFRGAAVAVADLDGDFLRDVVVTHDAGLTDGAGGPLPATRAFRQDNTGGSVSFRRLSGFLPAPAGSGDDDWRGDAVAAVDLDNDLRGDLVISLDGEPPAGASLATRALIQDPATGRLEDATAALLGGVLPSGDDGRAATVVGRDVDRDGDADLILAGPDDPGSGGRRTRLLLNLGVDPATGLPEFLDASSLLPDPSGDAGGAVALVVGDIDGDGDADLILTDTHLESGTPVRRTRVWRQDR